jgi:hypothetical protein
VKTGIQESLKILDSGFRRNDAQGLLQKKELFRIAVRQLSGEVIGEGVLLIREA